MKTTRNSPRARADDLFVVKRTATDRSTTSKPGPMRWEIAKRK